MKPDLKEDIDSGIDEAVRQVESRARDLFLSGRALCSEAVLSVINETLDGGLPTETAIRLSCGLPEGLGRAGCVCGALTGGVLALGLLLTPDKPGRPDRKKVRRASARLHDQFKEQFRSTCCRILIKNVSHDKSAHFKHCANLTAAAAGLTARLILEKRPELAGKIVLSQPGNNRSTWKKMIDAVLGRRPTK